MPVDSYYEHRFIHSTPISQQTHCRMKRTITTLTLIFVTIFTISAQEQKRTIPHDETDIADLQSLLAIAGYESYAFDLSQFLDHHFSLRVMLREYSDGNMIQEKTICHSNNKLMLSKFSEEDQKEILKEGSAIDPKNGIFKQFDRLTIGFLPISGDSIRQYVVELVGSNTVHTTLRLRKVHGGGTESCQYFTRPFKTHEIKPGEFSPLLLLGSIWYDESNRVFRFCGESEIDPDLSSQIIKDIPHFYVFGIKIEQIE